VTAQRIGRAAHRARWEVVEARAKAVTDAMALEWLQDERDWLVCTVEGLGSELEVTGEERDAAVRLSEEREEQA
jgi:hypothetical protein